MGNICETITEKVVDRFLQNILFVDDKAFSEDSSKNSFDAKTVSDIFAKKGKLCSFYSPNRDSDIQSYSLLLSKADVIVLDWNLELEQLSCAVNDEDDVPISDLRGVFTKNLINTVVNDSYEKKLKLIIVYTGEYNLDDITDDIYKELNKTVCFKRDKFKIYSKNILILVRCKSPAKYIPELEEMYVSYENLPDFILSEFSKFVDGLIPVFAIFAIASIRDKTFNILNVFSKDLDPAFMGHFVSIPNSADAFDMLPSIFGTAISELLSANFDVHIDKVRWVDEWLDNNCNDKRVFFLEDKQVSIEKESIKKIVHSNSDNLVKEIKNYLLMERKGDSLSKDDIKKLPEKSTCLFCDQEKSEESNYKFAKLVQHSNIFFETKKHSLSLGTIVYKEQDENGILNDNKKYLLCIQQPCDSVRIAPNTSRQFIFLPLVKKNFGEPIIVDNSIVLFVDNKSYSIEIHSFTNNNQGCDSIMATQTDDGSNYFFLDNDNKKYIWISELKYSFAQKIVGEYSSVLSRVGVDNSEWLRLKRHK